MSTPRAEHRRASSATQEHDDSGDEAPLLLSRTKSQEFGGVESVAIDDAHPDPFKPGPAAGESEEQPPARLHGARHLIMLCGFLTSMSFGVTQVPLLYVFRLMTCDAWYDEHPAGSPSTLAAPPSLLAYAFAPVRSWPLAAAEVARDRCSIHEIESSTALSISLLGASTTVFGLVNLFISGSMIKRWGVKPTLLINVFFPALRLFVQNVGVEVWGYTGILITQCSQVINILGGPSGYILVLNTFVTEVVEYEGRTAALGRLAGMMMLGSALGFLIGGVVADSYGIKAPFRLTFLLFLSACAYVAIFLPHIPPSDSDVSSGPNDASKKKNKRGLRRFLGPLVVFAPRKFVGPNGAVWTEYGAFLLSWGVFLGILATGYLQTLLQLFATDVFGFGTKRNGWLIFMYSTLRGIFLTFAFPKLISKGRRYVARRNEAAERAKAEHIGTSERQPLLAGQPHADASTHGGDKTQPAAKKAAANDFDLKYTRFSLVADGSLTLLCTFVREGWQMYLVAAVLPFAAGTGSAAKGSILQMVGRHASSGERTDALAGLSLVENMARLSTTFLFGVIFAGFASIGRTELVFTCNAAVALVGFCILLMARFPPEDSRLLDTEDSSSGSSASQS